MSDLSKNIYELLRQHCIHTTIDRNLLEYHGSMNHDRDVVKEMIYQNLRKLVWKSDVTLLTEEQNANTTYMTGMYVLSQLDIDIFVAQVAKIIQDRFNNGR